MSLDDDGTWRLDSHCGAPGEGWIGDLDDNDLRAIRACIDAALKDRAIGDPNADGRDVLLQCISIMVRFMKAVKAVKAEDLDAVNRLDAELDEILARVLMTGSTTPFEGHTYVAQVIPDEDL